MALDALAVYVNAKSKLQDISIPQLAKIYTGETTNWKDLGGPNHAIVLYGRENNSGTYGYFKEHVLANKDFAAATQSPGFREVAAALARYPRHPALYRTVRKSGLMNLARAAGVRADSFQDTGRAEAAPAPPQERHAMHPSAGRGARAPGAAR